MKYIDCPNYLSVEPAEVNKLLQEAQNFANINGKFARFLSRAQEYWRANVLSQDGDELVTKVRIELFEHGDCTDDEANRVGDGQVNHGHVGAILHGISGASLEYWD